MEGTYADTGSAMALAASDGTQDCCSGFSIAGRVTYNHIRIVQAQGILAWQGVAGQSTVLVLVNQNYFDTNLVSSYPAALTTYKSNAKSLDDIVFNEKRIWRSKRRVS